MCIPLVFCSATSKLINTLTIPPDNFYLHHIKPTASFTGLYRSFVINMDPGTALAVVGLVLEATKQLHAYYSVWKGRDEDIAEIRAALLWLAGVFVAIKSTLLRKDLDEDQKKMICEAVESSREAVGKLEKRLDKAKKEGAPATLFQKVGDQGRRALYPFQKATILRLLELITEFRGRLQMIITLLNMYA
jgi:hypothetical protein